MNKIKNSKVIKFPESTISGEREVEAILFAAEEPLDVESIQSKLKKNFNVFFSFIILIVALH